MIDQDHLQAYLSSRLGGKPGRGTGTVRGAVGHRKHPGCSVLDLSNAHHFLLKIIFSLIMGDMIE